MVIVDAALAAACDALLAAYDRTIDDYTRERECLLGSAKAAVVAAEWGDRTGLEGARLVFLAAYDQVIAALTDLERAVDDCMARVTPPDYRLLRAEYADVPPLFRPHVDAALGPATHPFVRSVQFWSWAAMQVTT